MMEVAPGVYRLEMAIGDKPIAMYLLNGDRLTLVDTGLPNTPEEAYLPAVRRLGRSPDDVSLIVITHADADHIGGNAAARTLFPNALLACHPHDKRWCSDPAVITAERYDGFLPFGLRYDPDVFQVLGSWMGPAEPMDLLLQDRDQIRLSDDEWLTVRHVPGHTPGHLLLHNADRRYALAGDAVFGESQLTTSGERAAAPPYTNVVEYRSTIETIRELDIDLLLTCHYPVMRGNEVTSFLDASLTWSERAEEAVDQLLAATGEPVTLGEAIEALNPVLGPFQSPRELQWALLAHLDHAVAAGRATRTSDDEVIAWRAV